MQCVKPFYLKSHDKSPNPMGIVVPCGKCVACKIAKAREWSVRIVHELEFWKDSVFVTLTYDDEHLPEGSTLVKSDLQNYFKRLRHDINELKYYACGEYGEHYGRPHYHAIIFGCSLNDEPFLNSNWGKGMVHVGSVTYDSARYVAQYIDKKYDGVLADEIYHAHSLVVPFQICSQGIGLRFALKNKESLKRDLSFTARGVSMGLPQYYKRKLGVSKLRLLYKNAEHKAELLSSFHKKGMDSTSQIEAHKVKARKQREFTYKARNSINRERKRKL